MGHLSLVPTRPAATGAPVAYVPVRLLLAASGRCSCDSCCRAAVLARAELARPARGTDRQPVRNLHLLS
ncbi:MAG: hypothetical protein QOF82_1383 [Frankiales bacterium]|jgi:hypothetical protein|nr:hypothetical protein [Frankiales bacterium]